ncbi:MAG: hypothetical protein FWG55_02275, partial [Candidatus Bathyarchaeota archaeon]|nr:hypothetical protein [Candidatus Termiticorpusculum sp.]
MKTNFKPIFKTKLKQHQSHRNFLVLSLIFVLMFSALSASMLMANAAGPVYVATETELRDAINNAVEPTLIVLSADIQLTGTTLNINAGKTITLSSSGTGFFKLIGTPGESTITINDGGVLELAGINVTHTSGASGAGVYVFPGGTLTLSEGEITNNIASLSGSVYLNNGAGVRNSGTFTMTGGAIYGNAAYNAGGVWNLGVFTLTNGAIFNNTASSDGGGVSNFRGGLVNSFTMYGGTISSNKASLGGGVHNSDGEFTMFGGEILNNTATSSGGGVSLSNGNFILYDGTIFNNTANNGGGVYCYLGNFNMFGGEILNNTARSSGGGVYINLYNDFLFATLTMHGGVISNNAAVNGGGIYTSGGLVELFSGTISDNTASIDGGGVWVAYDNLDKLFVYDGMVFSD